MKYAALLLMPLALLTLGGCNTIQTFGRDLTSSLNGQIPSKQPHEILTAQGVHNSSGPCPTIQIIDELSSLSEFSPASSADPDNLVSQVSLSEVDSSCSLKSNVAMVDLKLAFQGRLGPKAKISSGDKPFFAYPFFLALTDLNGVVLAKEVFAASMTYERADNTHLYYEKLRQLIPVGSPDQAGQYKIMIGFQLDYDQLKYNRRTMDNVQGIESAPVKPDYSAIKSEITSESLSAPTGAPISVIPAER